jgi:hypothetical protein
MLGSNPDSGIFRTLSQWKVRSSERGYAVAMNTDIGSRVEMLPAGETGIFIPVEDAVDGDCGKPLEEGESGSAELLPTRAGEALVGLWELGGMLVRANGEDERGIVECPGYEECDWECACEPPVTDIADDG